MSALRDKLGPLGFYDDMPEDQWRALGRNGSFSRRRDYQQRKAILDYAIQQQMCGMEISNETIERLREKVRNVVNAHRETLRWRRRQEERRAQIRELAK